MTMGWELAERDESRRIKVHRHIVFVRPFLVQGPLTVVLDNLLGSRNSLRRRRRKRSIVRRLPYYRRTEDLLRRH